MRPEVSGNERPEVTSLRQLFGRLKVGYIRKFDSSQKVSATEILQVADDRLDLANVVMSRYRNGRASHALLLDIDHPAWLVKSSTPGHYHLYIDVPGGIPHERYFALLGLLADCGVIEKGYERTSRLRGFTCLRLPWIKKEKSDA